MRILHLNDNGSYVGGAEGYLQEVAAALESVGHRSFLAYLKPISGPALIPGAVYVPVPEWPRPAPQAIERLQGIIRDLKPDVAFVHTASHPAIVAWIARAVPTIGYVHSPYPVCPGSAYYLRTSARACDLAAGPRCLSRAQTERCCWGRNPVRHAIALAKVPAYGRAFRAARAVLVGSVFMSRLLQRNAYSAERLHVLPPILIPEPLPARRDDRQSRTVFFAGRLTPEKGLRQLVQAMSLVQGDWQLVVAGDGEEQGPCKALARDLGIGDRVTFAGWLGRDAVAEQLDTCACVVVPSLWPEPFGRTGPETFAHGKPVVAYDVGGIASWLEHGRNGLLVPPGNVSMLGNSISALLEHPELRDEMGERAREMVMERWSRNAHVAQLDAILTEAADASRRDEWAAS